MIGREKERNELLKLYENKDPQFVAIYGRRRVGKTYLVTNTFEDKFTFRHSGLSPEECNNSDKTATRLQLDHFYNSLKLYGLEESKKPKTWLDAFFLLEKLLIQKDDGNKQLVFIDELPWMDTPKSNFISALEGFWNSWACGRKNFMLIVCGSSNSWILNKLINNHGGLYGRLTYEIKLNPFCLSECESFLKSKNIIYSRFDIVQSYMVFGGIPYYLGYLSPALSLIQSVDDLFFSSKARLRNEFERLFKSVFKNPKNAETVVRLLSTKNKGFTRKEIVEKTDIKEGGAITDVLSALIASDFIVTYTPFGESKKSTYYKLIDPFCIFFLRFVEGKDSLNLDNMGLENLDTPKSNTWRGLAFENVCFNHILEIKNALGIKNVATQQTLLSPQSEDAVNSQIDLIIERRDNIINLCEMKFCSDDYTVSKEYYRRLLQRVNNIQPLVNRKCAVRNTLITTFGLKKNEYSSAFSDVIVLDDLFSH